MLGKKKSSFLHIRDLLLTSRDMNMVVHRPIGDHLNRKKLEPCDKNLDNREEGQYLTNRLTDEAINFIDENKEGPFFCTCPIMRFIPL